MKKIIIYTLISWVFVLELHAQPDPTNYIGVIRKDRTYTLERTTSSAPAIYYLGFQLIGNYEITITTSGTITLAGLWVKPDPTCKSYTFSQPFTLSSGEYTFNVPSFAVGAKLTIKFRDISVTAEPPVPPVAYIPPQNIVSTGPNYIRTTTPLIGKSMVSYNTSEEMVTMQYFDGLGRPVETVQQGITPSGKDLITIQEYDNLGRETNSWLPVAITSNNGAFADLAKIKTNVNAVYPGEAAPFSNPVYELSPLNRTLAQFGPGADWQNNGKAVETAYRTNTGTEVKYYVAGGTNQAPTLSQTAYYAAGQLFVTETKDEDGNLSCEFRDKLGQVVLTRQMLNGVGLDTYYVYNDFGNRCFVLPPRIQDEGITQDKLNLLAYQYKYDNRNRCTWKKFPGCEAVICVYDNADRLIYTQDGEQRKKSEWTFSIPDALGRATLTGTCKDTISVSGKVVKGVFSTAGSYKTYYIYVDGAAKTFVNAPTILSVNYYDGYEFLGYNDIPNDANTQYVAEAGYGACYGDHQAVNKPKCKGLLTGTMTAQMNPDGTVSSTYLYSVMYYDNRNRLVQIKSNNPLAGGIEKEYIAYDFIGNSTGKKHIHSATGKTTQTEIYVNTYDHAERLIKTTHQLNGGAITAIADNTYDEMGRLKTNMKGGQTNLNATYAYNVRSWTKSISSLLFAETLFYNESYGGSAKLYNGNISAMSWKLSSEANTRGYAFTYNNLSWLTAANYLENAVANANYKTAYSNYDKHGNILNLQRYGKTTATTYGLIDNLTMTYNGNQMLTANDAVANISLAESADFKNYSNTTPEYFYNANGAMTKDLNKGIADIQYNSLNLPRLMDIKSPVAEARNEYTYSASGQKLKVVQKWNPSFSTAPVIGSAINTAALTQSKTTDYIGDMIYENGALKRILIDGGYVEGGVYHYFLTDHLGNNRLVVNSSGTVVQKNHYYPFGTAFAETAVAEQGKQPYQFGNKELDQMSGLNWYDFSARYKDDFWFRTPDPLAEKHSDMSPYCAFANNPIRNVDPTGLDWYRHDESGATFWRESSENFITYDGQQYRNIGENYSSYSSGVRTDYAQNEVINVTEVGERFNIKNGEYIPRTITTDDGSKVDVTFNYISSTGGNGDKALSRDAVGLLIKGVNEANNSGANITSIDVSTTTTGKHSSTSAHYVSSGARAFDIDKVNGIPVKNSKSHSMVDAIQEGVKVDSNLRENYGPNIQEKEGKKHPVSGHDNHIHISTRRR